MYQFKRSFDPSDEMLKKTGEFYNTVFVRGHFEQ